MYEDLPTPLPVVDADRLRRNVAAMADRAARAGVALRPHVKTHKIPEIARMQVEAGASGLTVATLGEALAFAGAGFDDLFVAYPVWLDEGRTALLRRLLDRDVSLIVGCDGEEAAARLAAVTRAVPVMIEVDSGHHRTGVAPDAAGDLARTATAHGLEVRGAFTFPGHSYHPDQRAAAAAAEAAALRTAGRGLRAAGIADPVLSGGSSPSVAHLDADTLDEIRPGVYVFGDAQQWELGACAADEIAFTVHATVISRRPGTVVLDVGSKVLGADRAAWATGFGRLLDHPGARVVQLSEHHAVVEWAGAESAGAESAGAESAGAEPAGAGSAAARTDPERGVPPLGARVRVVPNHVCNAVNLVDRVQVAGPGDDRVLGGGRSPPGV
ncbi:alanine racemase [Nocardioides sambongensis]|uniref:alanine racemase n=1 Tax=Nocardioides sambongensis TaxID=2589074 RepID=UPI0018C8BF41|nr:alanine racemase [Nocardioides sambongensis]